MAYAKICRLAPESSDADVFDTLQLFNTECNATFELKDSTLATHAAAVVMSSIFSKYVVTQAQGNSGNELKLSVLRAMRICSRNQVFAVRFAQEENDGASTVVMTLVQLLSCCFTDDAYSRELALEAAKTFTNLYSQSEHFRQNCIDYSYMKDLIRLISTCTDREVIRIWLRIFFLTSALDPFARSFLVKQCLRSCLVALANGSIDGTDLPQEVAAHGGGRAPRSSRPVLSQEVLGILHLCLKTFYNLLLTKDDLNELNPDSNPEPCLWQELATLAFRAIIFHNDAPHNFSTVSCICCIMLECDPIFFDVLVPTIAPSPNSMSRPGVIFVKGRNVAFLDQVITALDSLLSSFVCEQRDYSSSSCKDDLAFILQGMSRLCSKQKLARKYCRSRILPPLIEASELPEKMNNLRGKLVRAMVSNNDNLKNGASWYLFILCKENASTLIKYTGMGNAFGFLMARGLLTSGAGYTPIGDYTHDVDGSSESDEETDTEEYLEIQPNIDVITGALKKIKVNNNDVNLDPEQQQAEMQDIQEKLEKLQRHNALQLMDLGQGTKLASINCDLQSKGKQGEEEK